MYKTALSRVAFWLTSLFFLHGHLLLALPEKSMVVITPSYNNEKWVEKNLLSILTQEYTNFRIIYIDDASSDHTYQKAQEIMEAHRAQDKMTLIHNPRRKGALSNLYYAIHSCRNDEIVVTIDGDDWLAHPHVLKHLNAVYSSSSPVWITYGSYLDTNGRLVNNNGFSRRNIVHNTFRQSRFVPSHLRTFYAWLFKKIKKSDLIFQGEFFPMAWDLAMMLPMVEMAGDKIQHIPQTLYIYNCHNPINDHKKNLNLQNRLAKTIRNMPRYNRLK